MMKKKYMLTAGSPPLRSMVVAGGPFPPMHVYRFSVLHQIKRLLQNPFYLESASWKFKEEKCPFTGERVFSRLHTSDRWKNADWSLAQDLAELESSDSKPPGLHFVCPLILFDDSTLCDNIGQLMAQPVLLTVGNISDTLRRQVDAWFILGMVPPYPKSSKERESDRKAKRTTKWYMEFYHSCLGEILTKVKKLSAWKEGVPVSIPNLRIVNLHLRLCMVIGDTKGHDDMCCHYNCHSSTIARMVRDCNIPQSLGDNPMFQCAFVEQASITEVVESAMNAVDNRLVGHITDSLWNDDVLDDGGLEGCNLINIVLVWLTVCFIILLLEKLNLLMERLNFGNESTDTVDKEDVPAHETKAVHKMGIAGSANI
jgi:hypothetical protein